MNKKIITIKGKKLDYTYECWESEVKGYPNMILKTYVIHERYKLFEIQATYAKQLKPTKYYVLAKDKKEAKTYFKNKFTWLYIISSVIECSDDVTNLVINNPLKYAIS